MFLAVDRELYEAASAKVMATLRDVDAVVEVLGWDEAFLAFETGDPEGSAREAVDAFTSRAPMRLLGVRAEVGL